MKKGFKDEQSDLWIFIENGLGAIVMVLMFAAVMILSAAFV